MYSRSFIAINFNSDMILDWQVDEWQDP